MVELCQGVFDGRGMPDYWALSVVVPNFMGKGNAMSCTTYRGVKLLEHAMKIVEKVLERRLRHMLKWTRCSVHSEEATRGTLREGENVVYVLR